MKKLEGTVRPQEVLDWAHRIAPYKGICEGKEQLVRPVVFKFYRGQCATWYKCPESSGPSKRSKGKDKQSFKSL